MIANPVFHALAHRLMTEEVIPTLEMDNDRLAAYRDALLARFSNPALKHRTWQIAMDGSQKLPQRLLGTIKDRLAKGLAADCATLGVAAWMRYATGIDERGHAIDVRDPLASRLKEIGDVAGQNPTRLVEGMLMVKEVFGDHLPNSASFKSCLVQHATSLYELGAAETVRKMQANLHPMT